MIFRSIGRKAFKLQPLQAGKVFPFFFQSPNRTGHRWFSQSVQDLEVIHEVLCESIHEQEQVFPVHARARRRQPDSFKRKPLSLPLADLPIEIEQLVNVVRRKGKSSDLDKCLDALTIRIKPSHVSQTLLGIDDAESAIHFCTWATRQPDFSHNIYTSRPLVHILARAKEFDKIWELLSELHASGCQLTDGFFNIIIKAYGEMGNDKEAICTLRKMQEFGVLPTAYSYNTLISVLLKCQKLDLAMEFYQEMQRTPRGKDDKFSHSMMVSALCNAGRLQEAHEMAMDVTHRGLSINNVIWTSLINGFCKAGKVDKGIELFSLMKDMALKPSVFTYSIIIGGFCKVGKLSDAMTYLERMKVDGIEPTAVTYTPLLDAFCKSGRIDEGRELLKKICADGGGSNSVLYCIFVFAYCQSERMDEACAIYDEMVKNGFLPGVSTYAVLIQGLGKAGRAMEALKVFNEMKERKCAPNAAVYKVMIKVLAKADIHEEAEKMYKEMLAHGYEGSASAYKVLMECLCQGGSLATAKEVLWLMFKTKCEVKASTVFLLLKGLCEANQVDSAYQVFKEISERGFGLNAQTYHVLIHGAFKADDLEKALDLCSEMRTKGCDDIYTYGTLYQIAWKAKRADALLDIYHDMRKRRVQANPFVLTIMIKAFCALNKVPEACNICSEVFEDGFVSSVSNERSSRLDNSEVRAFLPLLNHLQELGNVKQMVSIWDSILQGRFFSWYEHSEVDSPETLHQS